LLVVLYGWETWVITWSEEHRPRCSRIGRWGIQLDLGEKN
jgi:hypothetical protein